MANGPWEAAARYHAQPRYRRRASLRALLVGNRSAPSAKAARSIACAQAALSVRFDSASFGLASDVLAARNHARREVRHIPALAAIDPDQAV
jgi:hypothetical protein